MSDLYSDFNLNVFKINSNKYLLQKQAIDFDTQYPGYFHWLANKLIHFDIKKSISTSSFEN